MVGVQEGNSKDAGVLVKAEERAVGRVDRRLYRTYLAAWGPFFAIPLAMVTMALSERGLQVTNLLCSLTLCCVSLQHGRCCVLCRRDV